jgi:choline dehydrogenase-like flavoprotein
MTSVWRAYGDAVVGAAIDGRTFDGQRIRIRTTPQARNSRPYQGRPPCAGNSSCVPICPIGAKYDATVHVRKAQLLGAEFRQRCVVKRLSTDPNGAIADVAYERWSPERSEREAFVASAPFYVLAAHSIESAVLLLASGLCSAGPVGRNLMDHLQGYGGAITREPVFPFRGPPVTSGIDEFRDGDFRRERAAFRVSIGNDGWGRMEPLENTVRSAIYVRGLIGSDLRRAINERATRMLRLSFSTEMLPDADNRVVVREEDRDKFGNPRPRIRFHFPVYNQRSFAIATRLFGKFFDALGVTANDRMFSFTGTEFSGAGHIMGTCRMGATRSDSVVDRDGMAHEHPNLFLAGPAIFPTSGTANPTLTAAALALRTASVLAERAKAGRG